MASSGPSKAPPEHDIWSAERYGTSVAPFVPKFTTRIVEWLDPQPSDSVLDIGCGNGTLTAALAPRVRRIVGVDASPNMIAALRRDYPSLDARVADCRFLDREPDLAAGGFDKIFSNATLHWILRDASTRPRFFQGCFDALRPGGRMASESGALGNVAEVHAVIVLALVKRGVSAERARAASPWWFPSVETMRALVEGAGFEWVRGEVDLRQTELTECEGGGIRGWVKLFGASFRETLSSDDEWERAVDDVVEALEAVGRRQHDGAFTVNYIRLRFEARKPE